MQYLNNLNYKIFSSSPQTYSETLTLSLHESLFVFLCPRVNGDASLSPSWFDITCDPAVSPVKWEGLGGGRASLDSDSELEVLEIRLLLHLLVHQQHPQSQKKEAVLFREGWLHQIGWVFGKVPKGGGGRVICNTKFYLPDFGNFKQGFLSMNLI